MYTYVQIVNIESYYLIIGGFSGEVGDACSASFLVAMPKLGDSLILVMVE
jgi:hypothetical protein